MSTEFDPREYDGTIVSTTANQPAKSAESDSFVPDSFEPDKPDSFVPEGKYGEIDDNDLQQIASRNAVSMDVLREALPYFTGVTGPSTPRSDLPQKLAGEVGKAVAFELPQKFYVMSQSSPKVRQALDDLRDLIEDRKTGTQIAAEIATSIVPAVAASVLTGGASLAAPLAKAAVPVLAKETAKRAVVRAAVTGGIEGAAGGALLGVGRSRTGEELKGATEGAIMPGAIGAGLAGTFRAAQAFRKVKPQMSAEMEEGINKLVSETDISERVEARLAQSEAQDTEFLRLARDKKELSSLPQEIKDLGKQIQKVSEEGGDIRPLLEARGRLIEKAQQVRDFGSFLTGKPKVTLSSAIDEINKQSAVFGEELNNTYKIYRTHQIIPKELGELATAGNSKLSQQAQRALDLSISGRYAAADIDRALKTDAVRVLDDFATAHTAFQVTNSTVKVTLNKIIKEANTAGVSPEEFTSILRRATTPEEIAQLIQDPKKAEIITRGRQFLDAVREDVAKKRADRVAMEIGEIQNFVPQKLADEAVIVNRLNTLNKDIEKSFNTKLGNPSQEAKDSMQSLVNEYQKDIRELVMIAGKKLTDAQKEKVAEFTERAGSFGTLLHSIDYLSSGDLFTKKIGKGKEKALKAVNVDDMLRFTRSLDNYEFLGSRTEKIAGSALERTLKAPDIVLENNFFKLAQKYSYDVYRTSYYKRTVDSLKGVQAAAKAAGDTKSEAWVTNALKDLAGIRPGTGLAKYKEVTHAVQVWAYKRANETAPGSVSHGALTYLAESPEMLSTMLNSVYPYFLGGSIRSFVNNLGGATFTLAPEVGLQYSSNVFKGYLRLGKLFTKGEEIVLSDRTADFLNKTQPRGAGLYKAGETIVTRNPSLFVMNTLGGSGSLSHEAFSTLNKSLDENKLARVSTSLINKWTDASMFFFEKSESINRFVALDVGQDLARDLMTKEPRALSVLGKMDSSYRTAIMKGIQAGDRAEVQRLSQRWLVAKTMFDYNRLNQAEAARFMGPLFSTFTTYPANVWGDVVNTLREQGKLKGGADLVARRLLPLMAAMAIGNYFIPDQGESQVADVVFGKEKLAGMTPAASLLSMTTRGITPPALQTAGQGIKAVATADIYEFWRFFNSGMAFIPGASFIKFIGSDVPTAIYGRRESKTVLGRTVETFTGGEVLLDDSIREFTKDYKERFTNPLGD